MSDLPAFLRARLDEDEATAKRAAAAPAVQHEGNDPGDWSWLRTYGQPQAEMYALIDHQSRFDPARVLREVEAKRAVLEQCAHVLAKYVPPVPQGKSGEWAVASLTVEFLAAAYSDHPDYRQEWKS